MPEHRPLPEFAADWSPERRARFEALLQERATARETENAISKPIYTYPVPRAEIDRLAPAALRVFERVAMHLDLSRFEKMALLGLAEETEMPDAGALTQEQFYRLSYLIGIWTDIGAVFGNKDAIVRWLRAPVHEEKLAGRSYVDYLIGAGLPGFEYVRREAAYWAHNGW